FCLTPTTFMQNPVANSIDSDTGRAELTDFWAVLTNPVQLVAFPHVLAGALMSGGALMMAVALWHVWRTVTPPAETPLYRRAAALGAVVVLIGGAGTVVSGDIQGRVMTQVQPMQMATAEARYGPYSGAADAPVEIA